MLGAGHGAKHPDALDYRSTAGKPMKAVFNTPGEDLLYARETLEANTGGLCVG
jgi:hypothetical protein